MKTSHFIALFLCSVVGTTGIIVWLGYESIRYGDNNIKYSIPFLSFAIPFTICFTLWSGFGKRLFLTMRKYAKKLTTYDQNRVG